MTTSIANHATVARGPNLPQQWVVTELGEIVQLNPRDARIRELDEGMAITFVPMAAVDAQGGTISSPLSRQVAEVRKGFTPFRDGDVILAKITPCMENGKAAIARGLENGLGFGSTEFHVLRPEREVLPQWVFHFVRQATFRKDAAASFTGAVGQQRVPVGFLRGYPIPLAPISEQHRIVEEIEKQFSRLDAAVAALKRAQANLRRYRASVLKAACEGRLVPQDPNDEPASELLKRILAERRAKWEAEHSAKMRARGLEPRDNKWKEKHCPPQQPVTTGLISLPSGWVWASPDQLASPADCSLTIGPFGSDLKVQDYQDEGVPLVFVRNIRLGVFKGRHTRFISQEKADTLRSHRVVSGDILITKMGDPPGEACLYPNSAVPAIITADCIKWTLSPRLPVPNFFIHAIHAEQVRTQIVGITKGVAQLKVSLSRLKSIGVPLPPLSEQARIAAEVDRRLSTVDELEAAIAANLKRAERLRQAILKRAFEGKLVPQDPDDEPASVLLERIRAERAAAEKGDREVPKQPCLRAI